MKAKIIDRQSYYFDKIGDIASYAKGECYLYLFIKFDDGIKTWLDYAQLELIEEQIEEQIIIQDEAQDEAKNIKEDN